MNLEPLEQLNADPKDLDCGICYSRYAPITHEPLIMIPCGHTVCSSCFPNTRGSCFFCKGEIFASPMKNMLLLSIIERDSQVKKCPIHKQPLKRFCNDETKLLCWECIDEKHKNQYESIQKIESKIKEIKNNEEKIRNKKEEKKKKISEELQKIGLNIKRKLDNLYDKKFARDISNKKKLKKIVDTVFFSENDYYEHQMLTQGISEYEKTARMLQENWKDNPEGSIAAKILEISLEPEQAMQFHEDKATQLLKDVAGKEKDIEKIIVQSTDLCESSKCLFDRVSEKLLNLNPNIKLAPENLPKIARSYLLETFDNHGLIVDYQQENDCFEIKKSTTKMLLSSFYPDFFECSIEKLRFSCLSASDSKFQVLCDILQNIQGLSHLIFSLKETSSKKVNMISSLVSRSKTLQKISFDMPLCDEVKESSRAYIKSLLISKKISGFHAGFTSETLLVDLEQDLSGPSTKAFEQFSAKFTGNNKISGQFIPLLSSSFSNIKALRKISLHFGAQFSCCEFIINLQNHSQNLQELDLGFAQVEEFQNYDHGQQISQVILASKKLKKVSLFLAGKDLSKDVFDDFFYLDEPKVFTAHKLEEFTLTIMRCRDVDLEDLIEYFLSFPKLKKIVLRLNRVYLDFQRIENFLTGILKLESLVSFEFACRDYGQLTEAEKNEIDFCKYRLEKTQKIQHRIVFEDLQTYHLPDYVDFISEDEEEQEENEYENEDEEEGEEEEEYDENEEEAQEQDLTLEEMWRIVRRRTRREAFANQG